LATPETTMAARRAGADTGIVDIRGAVTAESEDELMAAYGQAADERTRFVVLNFSGLEYMNSGGIGLLVTLLVRANRARQRLLACGLSEHYRQIFEVTRLDEAIEIHRGEAEALAAVGA
jgi:anti-sigma B factor antagonist